ncbi:MAG: hypothetical protein J6C62_07550 [Clostridia bacterium]|nr:hypothetical protein [Clostridia bacterium]
MDNYDIYLPKVTFEAIPIKDLVSSQEYQREISNAHVQKAAENFDLYQINPVKVSRRNGINYVFNGQHTIEIVALVSGSRETPVWCMVYEDLIYEHEADIFANQGKFVKPLQAIEIFQANLEANNETQLTIKALVESYGLNISGTKAPGNICAVSTLEKIFTRYNYHVLDRTIKLISGTWEGDCNSFSANILRAVAKLIAIYKNELNDDVFKERLGDVSIKQLIRTAKERRPGTMGVAEAMVIEYNGKKKISQYRLSIQKLYDKDDFELNHTEEYTPDDEIIDTPYE